MRILPHSDAASGPAGLLACDDNWPRGEQPGLVGSPTKSLLSLIKFVCQVKVL